MARHARLSSTGDGSKSVHAMDSKRQHPRFARGRKAVALVLVPLLTVSLTAELMVANAQAQERPRRTLMQMLFGTPTREPEPPPVMQPPVRKRRTPPPEQTRQPVRPAPPPPVQKAEDARRILVVGDFLAGGLGEGLTAAFSDMPDVAVDIRSSGSSGLVRTDYYDWPAELPALIDEIRPVAVVIMLGSNDRQQMSIGETKEKYATDAWMEEYRKRIAALGAIVSARKVPLLWVGLPSFQSPAMSADVMAFNRLYRSEAEKNGSEFIDIWDGFADESGRFIATGSDITGQQVRLRGSDGINLTTAGKRKLAFYTEKFLRRHLDSAAITSLIRLDATNLPALGTAPQPQGGIITRTLPVSISDPELDGGKVLLGGRQNPVPIVETPRDMLVRRGSLPDTPGGRVDDDSILRP